MQAKLAISSPGDEYEREANRVAQTVMSIPDAADDEREGHRLPACPPTVQRKTATTVTRTEAPPIVDDILSSAGHPLDADTRAFMEPRFGYDFSSVRIHTDEEAAQSARTMNALAYTVGNHVVFDTRAYAPLSSSGKHLVAHELAHVAQQGEAPKYSTITLPYVNATRAKKTTVARMLPPITWLDYKSHGKPWGIFNIVGPTAWQPCPSGFFENTKDELEYILATPIGSRLIAELRSVEPVFIVQKDAPYSDGDIVGWTSNYKLSQNDCPGSGRSWLDVPSFIWLFHELVHHWLVNIKHQRRGPGVSDCKAVGLGSFFTSEPFNENRLRCDLGEPPRPCYAHPACEGLAPPVCRPEDQKGSDGSLTTRGQVSPLIQRQIGEPRSEDHWRPYGPQRPRLGAANIIVPPARPAPQLAVQPAPLGITSASSQSHIPVLADADSLVGRGTQGIRNDISEAATKAGSVRVRAKPVPAIARAPRPEEGRYRGEGQSASKHVEQAAGRSRSLVSIYMNTAPAGVDNSMTVDQITNRFYEIPVPLLPPDRGVPLDVIMTIGPYGCDIRRYGLTEDDFSLTLAFDEADIQSQSHPFGEFGLRAVECWTDHVAVHADVRNTIRLPSDVATHACRKGEDAARFQAKTLAHERLHEADNNASAEETMRRLLWRLEYTPGIGSKTAMRGINDDPAGFVEDCKKRLRTHLKKLGSEYEVVYREISAEKAIIRDPHDQALHYRKLKLLKDARARSAVE